MRKLIVAGLLLPWLLAANSFADQATINTPKNENGGEVHPLYGGYKYTYISTIAETLVCSGPCLLAEFYMSTGVHATYVRFKDTGAIGGAETLTMFPYRFYEADNTAAARPNVARPIRARYGITAQINSVSAGEQLVVGWLQLQP